MAKFRYLNVNPNNQKKNDCVTRAIKLASGLSYETIRKKLFHVKHLLDCESSYCVTCYSFIIQEVLGGIPKNCDGMTVNDFAEHHPKGTYLLRMDGHLTTLIDYTLYDIFDCRDNLITNAWQIYN